MSPTFKTLALLMATLVTAGVNASPAEEALNKSGCMACHAKDKRLVGPGFKEIAAKYKGQDVSAKLFDKVRKGGSGAFGPIPMSPNGADKISDGDLKAAIEFILKS